MKAVWDPKVDAIYFELSRAKAVDSEEIQPGVIVDYGRNDRIVGIEILNFAKNFKRTRLVETLREEAVPVTAKSMLAESRPRKSGRYVRNPNRS